jgi:2-keto-4-pentenoate hydratase/2-oxohepta-3-ene-1,7-dioic acid hydratase in catechol pathway
MRYVSFRRVSGIASFGRLAGDLVHDLGDERGGSLREALAKGFEARHEGVPLQLADLTLLPVIPDPAKIFCIGLNYASHIAEMGNAQQVYPTVFTRWADTLVAHGAPLEKPAATQRFDYEGELAVIIGRGGRAIARERALEHVAGYAVFNDASVRDWQRHSSQFTPGKNFPATGGFGPALVTPDEIDDLAALRVQTRLNGTMMQDQPLADLIFDVPALIEYLSGFTELSPGDVIATGTPGGVGDGRVPPVYLQVGDVVEISIGAVGTLVNPVIAGR